MLYGPLTCWKLTGRSSNLGQTVSLVRLSLSQTTIFRLFQTERGCRRQFQIWWKLPKVLRKGRKHCGKRRNCSLWEVSPFPTVFSNDFYCRHVKTRACFGKGYTNLNSCANFWIKNIIKDLYNSADIKFVVTELITKQSEVFETLERGFLKTL